MTGKRRYMRFIDVTAVIDEQLIVFGLTLDVDWLNRYVRRRASAAQRARWLAGMAVLQVLQRRYSIRGFSMPARLTSQRITCNYIIHYAEKATLKPNILRAATEAPRDSTYGLSKSGAEPGSHRDFA